MTSAAVTRRLLLSAPLAIAACTLSLLRSPLATPSQLEGSVTAALTPAAPTPTGTPTARAAQSGQTVAPATQPIPDDFCDDQRPLALIEDFWSAISSADGVRLSSLVSPQHGMDARLLRDGRVVNYDREHAAALFLSTYIVDWGTAPGSGLPVKGSFRELFVPDLSDVFSRQHSVACNTIKVGGTTYSAKWPYPGIDFYSVYYPGSAENGGLDWHTWMVGVHFVQDAPYLYAITQLKWEP